MIDSTLLSGISRPAASRPMSVARPLHFALLLIVVAMVAIAAGAQDKKGESQLRTLHGTAIDKDENPVPASVVYLLNVRTQAVTTRIADEMGTYRFSGLDPNVNYEVHAEHDDMTSATRTISSFDSRRDIEVILKISRKKAAR